MYQTKADWGTTTVINLAELTVYTFEANAKNQEGFETVAGPSSSLSTTSCSAYGDGDFEPDGDVDLADFAAFQRCFGQSTGPGCEPANMAGDDTIGLDDFAELSDAFTGPGP